jgi:hypothetical protein
MNKNDEYVTPQLIEAIRSYPTSREISHCGETFAVSPFDIQVNCPMCNQYLKVRSFAAIPEFEDVFDAVFEWLINPEAMKYFEKRKREIIDDSEE